MTGSTCCTRSAGGAVKWIFQRCTLTLRWPDQFRNHAPDFGSNRAKLDVVLKKKTTLEGSDLLHRCDRCGTHQHLPLVEGSDQSANVCQCLELFAVSNELKSPQTDCHVFQGAYRMRGINRGQRLVIYAIPEAPRMQRSGDTWQTGS